MIKKSLFFFGLIMQLAAVSSHESHAIVQNLQSTADKMQRCAVGKITSTFNHSINRITSYANSIQNQSTEIVNGNFLQNDINALQNSFSNIQSDFNTVKNSVINPLDNAFGSINTFMIENMAAVDKLARAMKDNNSTKTYIMENGQRVAVEAGAGQFGESLLRAIDTLPSQNDLNSAIGMLNGTLPIASGAATTAKNSEDTALDKVRKVESALSKVLGEDISVNEIIRDIDILNQAGDIMNMNSNALPNEFKTLANLSKIGPAIQAFQLMNTVQRVQHIQDFINTLNSIQSLQALQNSAFTAMQLATEVNQNVQKLVTALNTLDAGSSVMEVAQVAQDAQGTFNDTKAQVGDIQAMAAQLQQAANGVQNISDAFKNDINSITNIFNSSTSLSQLLQNLGIFPGLDSIVNKVVEYLGVKEMAQKLHNDVMGFGSNAAATENIMAMAQPVVNSAKTTVSGWGDSLKQKFIDADNDAADVNSAGQNLVKKENIVKKIKDKADYYQGRYLSAQQALEDLEVMYADSASALASIQQAKNKLQQTASSFQLKSFATDVLGITTLSRDVVNSYKSLARLDKDDFLRPVTRFKDQLDKFTDVKTQLQEIQDLANDIANAQNVINGIQNNIENLGAIIQCFNVDVDALLNDLMLRVQDYIVQEMMVEVAGIVGDMLSEVSYLLMPKEPEPFDKEKINKLWDEWEPEAMNNNLQHELNKIAGIKESEAQHPQAGLQFAEITYQQADSIDDFKYENSVMPTEDKYNDDLDYSDVMSAWELDIVPSPSINAGIGVEWDFGDWSSTAWMPIVGSTKCGFDLTNDFCWYWQWNSCFMIPKCYKTPVLLPACMTNFDYKEPTVHVEIAPRAGTSELAYLRIFRDIPSNIKEWSAGGKGIIPSAHVMGISPMARKLSNLNVLGGNLTMTCDIAKKMDKFEYVQYYGLPTGPAKIAMKIGSSLVDLKDWKKEWFTEDAPELGSFPAPLQALYLSEVHKNEWNPRIFPNGYTPSGETKEDFEDNREESYKWALPYLKDGAGASGTAVVENIMMNKCDAGLTPPADENVCVGKWGALFPRNGQIATEDTRFPLKRFAQLAYRAYDRTLEKDLIQPLKVQPGTEKYGVGYDKTEFSIDWPYKTERMKVGEHPKNWVKGYYGEDFGSGGMVMTMWKDTSCCVKACCDYSMIGYYPGETYYWDLSGLMGFEGEKWKITDVTKHK